MKKRISAIIVFLLILTACSTGRPAQQGENFPSRDISGIVQWGAGGGTDSIMRPLAALAGDELGVSIVIQNMTGATGSIATQFVYDAAPDGYTLLMGAENPVLYSVLDISELTYNNFESVFLIGDETVGIAVGADSPFYTFTELVDYAAENPGSLRLSTTGTGGLPWSVAAFITDITGASFNQIPYDSDASARTAVINGECDFTVIKVQSGVQDHRAGTIRFLTMLSLEPVPAMPEVPLIISEYPDFERFLPWGPFYGIFVREGTPPQVTETLSNAFSAAASNPAYQEILENFGINFLGLTGAEADAYIEAWQNNTINALRTSGAIG